MSLPEAPRPSMFFFGMLWNRSERSAACLERAEALWGPVLAHSQDFRFGESAYYEPEMGPELVRTYYLYEQRLMDSAELVERKLQAAELERSFAVDGKRTINLDPGYLNGHQVVIATFKDFAHRIHLGRGVYAHLEYLFQKGEPVILPWTYPDFRRKDHLDLFRAWRKAFKSQ